MSLRIKSKSNQSTSTSKHSRSRSGNKNNKNNTGRIHYCRTATQIGEGGFGIVIKCNNRIKQSNNTQPIPNEFVLKIPKYYPIHMSEGEGGNEIRNVYAQILDSHASESQLCKSLKHPNIVDTYDLHIMPEDIEDDLEAIKRNYDINMWSTYLTQIFQQRAPKYLTLEYCNLGDLNGVYHMLNNESYFNNELLANEDITSFRNKLATTLVFGIGSAICYLHTLKTDSAPMGIVHNDIKAENIMVSYDTRHKKVIAKLGDFGLSFMPTTENPSLYGGEKSDTMNIGTIIYTPFHLLHHEHLAFIERNASSPRHRYKIGKDVHINTNTKSSQLNTNDKHADIYRSISYFSDWFAYMNVITMLFSNMFINTELIFETGTQTQTIILYGMLNTLDTVKEDTHDSTLFKILLLKLQAIEFDLYDGYNSSETDNTDSYTESYDDTLSKYTSLHRWFSIFNNNKVDDWTDLEVRFVDYKSPSVNNISNIHSTSNSKSNSNSMIARFEKRQKTRKRAKNNKQSLSRRKSSKKKSISGYGSQKFHESNIAV